jgi:hypothetical protein
MGRRKTGTSLIVIDKRTGCTVLCQRIILLRRSALMGVAKFFADAGGAHDYVVIEALVTDVISIC